MKISVQELRAISERLWSHLEVTGHEDIELQHDFYWHVAEEHAYDLKSEPVVHVVGQLADDWSAVLKVLEPDREPIAYDLVWFSAVLRAVGEQIVA